jgi:hypothetical protein
MPALGTRARVKFFKLGRPVDDALATLLDETALVFDDMFCLYLNYVYIYTINGLRNINKNLIIVKKRKTKRLYIHETSTDIYSFFFFFFLGKLRKNNKPNLTE